MKTLSKVCEVLELLDEEEDRIKRHMASILIDARMNTRPEFADRLERYMLKHNLLPRGEKSN